MERFRQHHSFNRFGACKIVGLTYKYWKDRAGGVSGTMKKITRTQLLAESMFRHLTFDNCAFPVSVITEFIVSGEKIT